MGVDMMIHDIVDFYSMFIGLGISLGTGKTEAWAAHFVG